MKKLLGCVLLLLGLPGLLLPVLPGVLFLLIGFSFIFPGLLKINRV